MYEKVIVKENGKVIGSVSMNDNLMYGETEDKADGIMYRDPEKCLGITRVKRDNAYLFVLIHHDTDNDCTQGTVITENTAAKYLIDYQKLDLIKKYFPDGLPDGTKIPELIEA